MFKYRLFEPEKMLDRLHSVAKDPDVLINGDKTLTDLFYEMTAAFYKSTNESDFHPMSINDKTELIVNNPTQKFFIWEQINRQNLQLNEAIKAVNFDEENNENDEEEEEEEIKENEENQIIDESEEEKNEDDKTLDKIHISEMEDNEEEEDYDNEMIDDEEGEAEFQKLILEEDDAKGNEQYRYEDLYGNEPPVSNSENDFDDENNDEDLDPKTKQIKEIEQRLISKKPWEMSGETLAPERPLDSLADIDIDFDFTSTEPPEPPATSELEALLIKRIESMNFDDVVRKKKQTETAREIYQINTERSKLGLADEYANDYLKKMQGAMNDGGEQLTPKQQEAINLWNSLEHELNKFTERRYVARRPRENITISQGVSLDVEEKPEPTKAPEEIMAPAGSIRQMKGELETTHDERKAARRISKEKKIKERIAKDAAKGVLYSSTGRDGAEIKAQQDVKKLLEGKLQNVEVVKPGEKISDTKEKPKNINNKFLL